MAFKSTNQEPPRAPQGTGTAQTPKEATFFKLKRLSRDLWDSWQSKMALGSPPQVCTTCLVQEPHAQFRFVVDVSPLGGPRMQMQM